MIVDRVVVDILRRHYRSALLPFNEQYHGAFHDFRQRRVCTSDLIKRAVYTESNATAAGAR